MSLSRASLAFALGLATTPAFAAGPTLDELARRLQALEQRLGTAPDPAAAATDAPDLAALDQRLRVLERKLELQAEADAARTAAAPVVSLSDKGVALRSAPPGDLELKFRGLVQADGRFWFGDDAAPQKDTFLLRRVEPTLEGTWGKLLGFRLQAQLAGDSASLNDAYVDLRFDPRATLRIGKYKAPFGLEQLQASGSLAEVERGLPSELTPARDYGVQLQGETHGGLSYAAGVFNGTVDGRDASSSNPDSELEYAGRVFWEPFKDDASAWSGLGFGLAASAGDKFGAAPGSNGQDNSLLPLYRSPGQVRFFGYRAEAVADGLHRRWSPQAYYYGGPFGLLAEYVSSEQEVLLASGDDAGRRSHLGNAAYGLTASYVLTGEDAGYKGVAQPDHPFTPDAAGWGALELVARYGRLEIDDDAFPLFADPAKAAAAASSWSLGVNWYLTRNFKLVADYARTTFEGGAADGDRETEQVFLTRAQFSF